MKSLFLSFIILLILQLSIVQAQYNTDIAKKWKWQTDQDTINNIQGGLIKGYGTVLSYVNLPSGIAQEGGGIKWTLKPISIHDHNNANVCMGILKVSELGSTTGSKTSTMIGACLQGQTYANIAGSAINEISPMVNNRQDFAATNWDIILTPSKLIITNKEYVTGAQVESEIEFTYDGSLQYFPVINMFYYYNTVQMNTCSLRCATCNDFDSYECITCESTSNIEDAPSCQCKEGFTDIYNYKQNLACQADAKTYWLPDHFEWQYTQEKTHVNIEERHRISSDGVYETYSSSYTYNYVPLQDGIQRSDNYDIVRWYIKILEDTYVLNSGDLCFGLQNIEFLNQNQNYNKMNGYCLSGTIQEEEVIRKDDDNMAKSTTRDIKKGNQYRIDYEPKTGYLTITDLPFGGSEYVIIYLERQEQYYPAIIHYTGNNAYKYKVQVNKCLDRCTKCKLFQPAVCIACEDATNRESAPGCECKSGKNDDFRFPNIHYVDRTCKDDYQFAELKNPDFFWKSDSTIDSNLIMEDYDLYSNVQSRYINIQGDVGDKGMVVQQDGLKWQIKIDKHATDNGFICFGVQKVEQNWEYRNSYNSNQPNMCGICTDQTVRETHCMVYTAGIGEVYNLFYTYGALIISNEEFGGNVRYEYQLNEYLNYVPTILAYSTLALPDNQQIKLKTCHPRCASCQDWQNDVCITCNDSDNRQASPGCACKPGFEDEYDHKIHKVCRPKIQWKEPQPPEWEWNTYGQYLIQDIENENYGDFTVDYNRSGSLYPDGKPFLEDQTKWTVKITEYTKGYLCFGIQDSWQSKAYYTADSNGIYQNYGITVCTHGNYHYYHDHAAPTLKGTMPDLLLQVYDFDLYYEVDQLTITNENYGGDFRTEFPLKPERKYTPYIVKVNLSGTEGELMKFRVMNCAPRCKSCVSWTPTSCIQCNDAENREAAPGCACKPNYEDYYDHKKQKICRPIPNLLKPAPPSWVWFTPSTLIYEDIENMNYGLFKRDVDTHYGSLMLKDYNVIQDGTQWEIKILDHKNDSGSDYICMGILEVQRAKTLTGNSHKMGNSVSYCTNNSVYTYEAITGATSKTWKYGDMPTARDELTGKTFTLKFYDNFLNVSDGADIGADFELNPAISYTPYIYMAYRTTIQLKGCSHRCYQCVDFSPKQCTICNDENYRQSPPSCLCKDGYYDTYDHKFNTKCIPKPKYVEYTYPEWEWYTEATNSEEDPLYRGIYRHHNSQHTTYFVKGFPALTENTKWTVNILEHSNGTNNFLCFGIQKLSTAGTLSWTTSQYTSSVAQCTIPGQYIVGAKRYNPDVLSQYQTPYEDIKGYVDIFYEKSKLIITDKEYGGYFYAEFDLYENTIYTPIVSAYSRSGYNVPNTIQFQNCNFKCESCLPWAPKDCKVCKGDNRLGLPSCECKEGYIDHYDGSYHSDCILKPNVSIGQSWIWEIMDDQDRLLNNGDEIYYFDTTKTSYSNMYAQVGRDGIPELTEGVKWSVKINELNSNSDHICFGIQKQELYNNQNYNDHSNNRSLRACTTGSINSAVANGSSIATVQTEGAIPISPETDNQGLTYDLTYKLNSLEITNIPYGGTFWTRISLNPTLKFIPVIELYKAAASNTLSINIRPCHYKCDTCDIATSYTTCTACPADSFRSGSDCVCDNGYYDNEAVVCIACVHPCEHCKGERICTTCVSQPNRDNNPPFCTCLDTFFEDDNGDCVQCHYRCDGCVKLSENCSACVVQTGRSTEFPECGCLDGYYEDDTTEQCEPCHESCNKCKDGTPKCLECKSNQILDGDICTCASTSWDDNGVCTACENPCMMCSDATTCTSCRFPTPNRLGAPSCLCEDGYYEDENYRCLPCMEGCAICSGTATNCSQCVVDPNRSSDPTSCACNEGYIYNKTQQLCKIESCPDKCTECVEGSSTQCDTCKEGDYNRSGIADNCDCEQGYYEGGSIYCLQCNVECKSCINLSGCSQCVSTLNRGSEPLCQCNTGYYEDGTGNCAKCHYKCKSCSGTPESCTQCDDTDPNRLQSETCACKPGYEEDVDNEVCRERISCDFKCATCDPNSLSTCTECNTGPYFRKSLSSNCDCIDGYYDNKVEPTCQKCQEPCNNCELDGDGNVVCLTCYYTDANRNGAPNCLCPEGYTEDDDHVCQEDTGCKVELGRRQDGDCSCYDGYYDDPVYLSCLQCDPQCDTCVNSQDNCLTCALGYQSTSAPVCNACDRQCGDCNTSPADCTKCNLNRDTLPGCGCSSGFYDDGVSADCKKCHPKCGECSSFNECITCATNEEGRSSASKGCECIAGYFNNNGVCQKCSDKCLSCENRADYCIVCAFGLQRNFIAPTCGCNIGYHEQHGTTNCAKCSEDCMGRDNETGVYTNSQGGTYSFGVYTASDKLDYKKNTGTITEPVVIPDDYVDDGEGNLVPQSYFEEIQRQKEIEEAKKLIEQQKQEAEQLKKQQEEAAAKLAEEAAKLAEEEAKVAAQEAELQQKAQQAQEKEEQLTAIEQEIQEKEAVVQEKEAVVQEKEAEIAVIQQEIADKQANGEDTTALEQQVTQLNTEKAQIEEEIEDIEEVVTQKEAEKTTVEAEKLAVDQEVAAKEAEVQQAQQQLQEQQEEVQKIEEEVQENEEQLKTINDSIQEKSQKVLDLGGDLDDGEDGDSGSSGQDPSFSVNVSGGLMTQNECEGGCADCEEETPQICTRCLVGIKRLNNPPLCNCVQGYYQQGRSEDCRACPKTCSDCKSFDQCTKCQPQTNREVDPISGKCVCMPGFTEQRYGIECQRCYYYENICYQSCPKNTSLDIETHNCLEVETKLEDIRITILIIGIIAFVLQMSIFGIFVLLSKKRNFDRLYPKIGVKDQQQQPLNQEDDSNGDQNSQEEINSDNQMGNELPKITEKENEAVTSERTNTQIKAKQRKKSVMKSQRSINEQGDNNNENAQIQSGVQSGIQTPQQQSPKKQQTPKISFMGKGSAKNSLKNTPKNASGRPSAFQTPRNDTQNNSLLKFDEVKEEKVEGENEIKDE